MKKDGIGKLYCRICGYRYQKRLGPLDKQVDIYCAMIDDAEALNTQKQNDGIGFVGGADDEPDLDEDPIPAAAASVSDILNDNRDALKRAVSLEEEKKEDLDSAGLSASKKISQMGLSRNASVAVDAVKGLVKA